MSNLAYRQQKIQEKRKKTPWREFVMEICSWMPMNLYKNGGNISRYPETARSGKVVGKKSFDNQNYKILDINNQKSIFSQIGELFKESDKKALPEWYSNENADFVDCAFGVKNGYLSFGVGLEVENVFYTVASFFRLTNIFNGLGIHNGCENVYMSRLVSNSFNVFFSSNIHNSSYIYGSSNLIGCSECLFCNDLENQKHCIENIAYTKEEYVARKEKLLQDKSKLGINGNTKLTNYTCKNTIAQGAKDCSNLENALLVSTFKDSRNIVFGFGTGEHIYDGIHVGHHSSHFYGVCDCGTNATHQYCSAWIGDSSYIYYSINLENCSFCFGCTGLKNKSYCILNKQYSKEERYIEVDKIFAQMETEGTLGQFFPATMNPFYFNDTAAYLIDPIFTKEEVTAKGYLWRDEPIKVDIPADAIVVKTTELDRFEGWRDIATGHMLHAVGDMKPVTGDYQRYIDPEILKVIIQDESGNVYRIVKMEYDFLMKYGLPLPRKHWLERMKENFRIN